MSNRNTNSIFNQSKFASLSTRVVFLVSGICLALVTGCANDKAADEEASVQRASIDNAQASIDSTPARELVSAKDANRLVGIWLGTASIDEGKLQAKLDQLAVENRNGAIAKAQSFLSTTMAIEYKEDGSVENDLELVSVDGRLLRDGSIGTWRIVESVGDGLLIETEETLSDGTIATNQFDYKFAEDGTQFVLPVPVSEELQGCDATLVFKRQTLPVVNVADRDLQTQVK